MKTTWIGFLFLFSFVGTSHAQLWTVDEAHSSARFSVRHMMISNVTGGFSGITGTFDLNDKDPSKYKIDVTIPTNTINTNNTDRDKHLRSADFFDVEKNPTIKFKSKKVEKINGKLKITGDLTMHGVTKEITLDAEDLTPPMKDPGGNTRRGFQATTKLDRKLWGLSWNKALEAGGVAVGQEVDVNVEAELVSKTKKDAKS